LVQNRLIEEGDMPLERWDRFAPLTGIWAVVLWLVGVFIIEGLGDSPDNGTPQETLAYFQSDENSLYGGSIVFCIGSLLFIWWSGALRASIANAMGYGERLAPIVFAAGVATAVFSMALLAPQFAAAFVANEEESEFSPEAAQALWTVGDGFFVMAEFTAALLLAATGIAILLTRFLPKWLAWVSFVFAVVLLIPPIAWAVLIFCLPLWIVVVSLLLWRRGAPVVVRPL
jgi:hypothetical protein